MRNKKNAYCVFNLDDSSGAGTHWTAMAKTNGAYKYFDSFGCPPSLEIKRMFNPHYNKTIYQDIKDATCGLWVIKFILRMARKSYI